MHAFFLCALLLGVTPIDRQPNVAAPHVEASPTIDGTVDKREWHSATLLPALIDHADANATPQRMRVYVAHDGEKLYVAFQFDRPANALQPGDDDTVAVHVAGARYVGNLAGQVSGESWQYAARATDFGWEGEMALPRPDGPCAFNVTAAQRTPVQAAASFGYSGPGRLSFAPAGAPAVRFLQSGPFHHEDGGGASVEIVNASTAAADVAVNLELFQRTGGSATFLKRITQIQGQDDIDIVMPLADFKLVIEEAMADYAPLANVQETIALGGDRRIEQRVAATGIGDYLCVYRITHGETNLASGVTPLRIAPPLQIALQPYHLSPGALNVTVDVRQVAAWQDGAKLRLTVTDDAVEHVFDGRAQFDVLVPTRNLPPGGYELRAEVIAPDGQSQGEITEGFIKPQSPAWFTDPVGYEPIIPDPWRPIAVDGKRLSMLMGDYTLGDSALPSAIVVQSIYSDRREPVLRAPITLRGNVGGKMVTWQSDVAITDAQDHIVHAASSATAGDVRIDAHAAFEYDGMQKITLTIAPAQGAPAIGELMMEIPLAKGFADLYRPNRRIVDRQKMLAKHGALGDETIRHDWRPGVWIGNTRRGLSWFAENWKGWRFSDARAGEVIEVEPGEDGATLRVRFIAMDDGAPLVLDAPREITFGLMFTPPRPIDRRPVRYGYSYFQEGETWGDRLDDEAAAGVNVLEVWNHRDYQGWPQQTAEWTAKLRELDRRVKRYGMRVTPYSGWGISLRTQTYADWGTEMVSRPLTGIGCYCYGVCWNTPVTDAYLHEMREAAIASGYDGYRMDAGFAVFPCDSLVHRRGDATCGWIDEDGNVQPSLAIFGAREAARRSRRIYHHDKTVTQAPLLAHHIHGGNRFAPILSHMDVVVSAEGALQNATSLKDLDLSRMRAFVMEDKMGLQVSYHPKGDGIGYNARLALGALHRLTPRGGAIITRHEQSYSRSAFASSTVWFAEDWVQWLDPGTEFFGYWENDDLLTTSDPQVIGSFHVRRGEKLMLALHNRREAHTTCDVRLDLASLGFTGGVHAADVMLNEPVALSADGTMQLSIKPESYRLIRLANEPFDFGPQPKRIGDNLIPEMQPAAWPESGLPKRWTHDGDPTKWSIDGGEIVVDGSADEQRQLRRNVPTEAGKHYVLEIEVHCDADQGVYFGPSVARHQFAMCFGNYYGIPASTGSSTPDGEYVTLRRHFTARGDESFVRFWLCGDATARIRKIGVYEIDVMPRDARGLERGEIHAD